MATIKNTMNLIRKTVGNVNILYDMTPRNIIDILNSSDDSWDLVCNGFYFGYTQGMKAAKAEMRKGGELNVR